jgi:hypothetical protein
MQSQVSTLLLPPAAAASSMPPCRVTDADIGSNLQQSAILFLSLAVSGERASTATYSPEPTITPSPCHERERDKKESLMKEIKRERRERDQLL